jgi:hypothetical protein
VSFAGFVILAIAVLIAVGAADFSSLLTNQFLLAAVAFMGFLDVFCGLLLAFNDKKLRWLIAPQKKKTDNYVKESNEDPESDEH